MDLTPTECRHIRTIRATLEVYEREGGTAHLASIIEREGRALAYGFGVHGGAMTEPRPVAATADVETVERMRRELG